MTNQVSNSYTGAELADMLDNFDTQDIECSTTKLIELQGLMGLAAEALRPNSESSDDWYERERAAFIAWWEAEGQKQFSETPTLAAGAGWLARADALRSDTNAAPQAEPRLKGTGRSGGCVDSTAETASPAVAAPITPPSGPVWPNNAEIAAYLDSLADHPASDLYDDEKLWLRESAAVLRNMETLYAANPPPATPRGNEGEPHG